MAENNQLTPEEEAELAELEQLEQQNQDVTLTAEEEAELAELEAMEAQAQEPRPINEDVTVSSPVDATTAGYIQGLTAEFGDEVAGAFGAIKDITTDENVSITDFYQQYKSNKKNYNKALLELQQKYPEVYQLAKAGGVATLATGVGALTGGLGTAGLLGGMAAQSVVQTVGEAESLEDEGLSLNAAKDAITTLGVGTAGMAVASSFKALAQLAKTNKTAFMKAYDHPFVQGVKDAALNAVTFGSHSTKKAAAEMGKSLLNFANTSSQRFRSPGSLVEFDLPIEQAPAGMLNSLRKIGNVLISDPDKYNKAAAKLAMVGQLSSVEFMGELSAMEAQIDLEASPLTRTTEDVLAKKNQVLTMMERANPEAAELLENAIETNDIHQIGSIMSMAANLPEAGKFVLDGVGWDGKVFHPEEMALVEKEIQGARKPAWQKKEELELLRTAGQIPINPPQPYFQKQPVKKIKDSSGKKLGDF